MTLTNPVLERMRNDEVALGMIVRLSRSGEIAKIAAATDHDFIFIDLQHGPFSSETACDIALVAHGCNVAPIVRVRSCDDPDIGRLLDCGVMGIVVPDVATADQARRAVAACRFPPLGRRSMSSTFAALDFRRVPPADAVTILNDNTLVVCMIETLEGVRNLDAIAGVEGVDVLHLGCNDLLTELERPGRFDNPELDDIRTRLIETCRAQDKFAGLGGDKDQARQSDAIQRGVRFITTHSDLAFLATEAGRRASELRAVRPVSVSQ